MPENAIRLGTALVAPEGFASLQKGVTYFFLVNSPQQNVARLVEFIRGEIRKVGKKKIKRERRTPIVNLFKFSSALFEEGIREGKIQVATEQFARAPWRAAKAQEAGNDAKKKASLARRIARIDRQLGQLAPLVVHLRSLLSAADPMATINAAARSASPKQNQARFRANFFLYAVFGKDGLDHDFDATGKWSRVNHAGKKSGPKAAGQGAEFGRSANDEASRKSVSDGWDFFSQPGRSIREVYRLTCTHILGCTTVRNKNRSKRQVLPDGQAAYTYDQFYHRLIELYGLDEIRRMIHGRALQRESFDPSEGQFSESVNSAGEIVEEDARWVDELAIGPDGKTPMPALVVVRIVCVATAICLGMGFALGSETGAAYRMARFCMAVGKDFFCALFGITVPKDDWPCEGEADYVVTDRGPGQTATAKPNSGHKGPLMAEMPPTGFGQGKPNVESTHAREIKIHDRPHHILTRIPLIHLMRREVRREIVRMNSASVQRRLGPTSINEAESLTCNEFYRTLLARGRTCERQTTVDRAVRKWLTKVPLSLGSDGVYLGSFRYDSQGLRDSGVLRTVHAKNRDRQISGYSLDMCRRFLWVEVGDRLIMVAWMQGLREGDEQLFVTAMEQEALEKKLKGLRSDARQNADAVFNEQESAFYEETGVSMTDRQLRPGHGAKKTKDAKQQAATAKDQFTSKRRAA